MLFGITGKARSGKDTIGNILAINHQFYTVAFADPLKSAASTIFSLDIEHFYEDDLKEVVDDFWGMSPRTMLQKLGTDACRNNIDSEIWVKSFERGVLETFNPADNLAVTDVRFNNEADKIRSMGGKIIHVVSKRLSALTDSTKLHASEAGVIFKKDSDIMVWNDGTIEDLTEKLKGIVEAYGDD